MNLIDFKKELNSLFGESAVSLFETLETGENISEAKAQAFLSIANYRDYFQAFERERLKSLKEELENSRQEVLVNFLENFKSKLEIKRSIIASFLNQREEFYAELFEENKEQIFLELTEGKGVNRSDRNDLIQSFEKYFIKRFCKNHFQNITDDSKYEELDFLIKRTTIVSAFVELVHNNMKV